MDITEVKRLLADRALSVAEYLLPGGHREAQEWRVGSVEGEGGQSLGVHLTGQKAGIWTDFNSGEGGDLIDLWSATRRLTIGEALQEARAWLGIERPRPHREPQRTYRRPPKPKCRAPEGRARDYLVEDRNIPADILTRYKIGEQGDAIVFPFLLPDGELALAKTRKTGAGERPKPTASDCEPILFGWQAIDPNCREIVLTEGEIDALSWAAYGWPAMSIPFGGGKGGKQGWIESEFERMERFEKIYLATDMDPPGEEAAAEIASRLGRHRCYRVSMPYKDANECLVAGVAKEEMDRAILEARNLDPEGLRKAGEFSDAVVALFWPAEGAHIGYSTPYGKLKGEIYFRPSEVSLWSGASGAGKSQLLSDCSVEWIRQGSRICLSSLEMRPAQSLKRMCKQVLGVGKPTEKAVRDALTWLDQGLLIYDLTGKVTLDHLIEVFDYARAKYGCDQFVIDSLMRLGIAGDDYTGQERAVFRLVDWTVSHEVHLHLVAHSRKGGSNGGAPETEDIKGAMEIGANAFNILTVWRNRELEDEIRSLEMENKDAEANEKREVPGVMLNVAKQRNGDFEGKIGLWFDKDTYRYHSSHERSTWSREYIPIN